MSDVFSKDDYHLSISEFMRKNFIHKKNFDETSSYIAHDKWRSIYKDYLDRIFSILENGWNATGFVISLSILNKIHYDIKSIIQNEIEKTNILKGSKEFKKQRSANLNNLFNIFQSHYQEVLSILCFLCKEEDVSFITSLEEPKKTKKKR